MQEFTSLFLVCVVCVCVCVCLRINVCAWSYAAQCEGRLLEFNKSHVVQNI